MCLKAKKKHIIYGRVACYALRTTEVLLGHAKLPSGKLRIKTENCFDHRNERGFFSYVSKAEVRRKGICPLTVKLVVNNYNKVEVLITFR